MENIISNNSKNVKCPRCQSSDVYKFGKDPKTSHQKYQCKSCKHQGTFLNPVNKDERKFYPRGSKKGYPSCPLCKHATYIHHDYKYYTHFQCGNKKCGHSVFIIKPTCIGNISSSNLLGKTNFKRLRFPLFVVMQALMLFYVCNSPARKISRFLLLAFNIKVSHVTICNWIKCFADDISNNLIESFNKTFKSWYKSKLGFKSFDSANNMVFMFVYFYNFINPHSSLSNLTPAQVAGTEYSERDKQHLLLAS